MRKMVSIAVSLAVVVGALLASAGPASAATLVADYQFQNNLSSSSGSAPDLTHFTRTGTASSFVTETVLNQSRTVYRYPDGNGLVLNGANNVIANSYSIVMLVRLDDIDFYNKLVDYRNGTSEDGLYVVDGDVEAFGCNALSGNSPVSSNTYAQIVITRDASKMVRLYVNGTEVGNGLDTGDSCVVGAAGVLRFFVDDNTGACADPEDECEETGGSVARLRLYNGALTAQEVAALDRLPGDPSPSPTSSPTGTPTETPTSTPTGSPSPTPTSTVTTHERSVTFSLKRHLVAAGAVTAVDGFDKCAQNVPVRIQRRAPGHWRNVKLVSTSDTGTYRTRLADRPGIYRVLLPPVNIGASDLCVKGGGIQRRHRH